MRWLAILVGLTVAGCSGSKSIVGKWRDSGSAVEIEFKADGSYSQTMSEPRGGLSETGHWVIEGGSVKTTQRVLVITVNGTSNTRNPPDQTTPFAIAGDKLTLSDPSSSTTLTRE